MCHFTGVKKGQKWFQGLKRESLLSVASLGKELKTEKKFCIELNWFWITKEIYLHFIVVGKVNMTPVLRSLSDFHCTIRFTHTFFLFYFQSAKCSRLRWLCLCPNTWEAVLGLNSGTTAGVCLLSMLIGWFFHPPSFTLTNQNSEKSPSSGILLL